MRNIFFRNKFAFSKIIYIFAQNRETQNHEMLFSQWHCVPAPVKRGATRTGFSKFNTDQLK